MAFYTLFKHTHAKCSFPALLMIFKQKVMQLQKKNIKTFPKISLPPVPTPFLTFLFFYQLLWASKNHCHQLEHLWRAFSLLSKCYLRKHQQRLPSERMKWLLGFFPGQSGPWLSFQLSDISSHIETPCFCAFLQMQLLQKWMPASAHPELCLGTEIKCFEDQRGWVFVAVIRMYPTAGSVPGHWVWKGWESMADQCLEIPWKYQAGGL